MAETFTCRPARPEDMEPAYAVFRRALFSYLFEIGMTSEAEKANPPIASAWRRQSGWIIHLWTNAAENWVAEDATGRVVGWAMSAERDDHLELTHFFVEPGMQTRGLGRELLARAFPTGRGAHRTILATQNPRALRLYLQAGVDFTTVSADFLVSPGPVSVDTDMHFIPAHGEAAVAQIAAVEREVLGVRRDVDIRYLLADRPAWTAWRDGRIVGYAFGAPAAPADVTDSAPGLGPIAALDPSDIPAMIDHVLAQEGLAAELFVNVPMTNTTAVRHLLGRGAQIDPFYIAVLSSRRMNLDRYIHTSPSFIL